MLKFLGIAQSVAELGKVQPEAVTIPRKAEASFVDLGTGRAYNADVVLLLSVEGGSSGGHVERMEKLDEGVQPAITLEELNAAEDIIRKDARVLALAKDVGVEPHQLFAVRDGIIQFSSFESSGRALADRQSHRIRTGGLLATTIASARDASSNACSTLASTQTATSTVIPWTSSPL